MFVHYLSSNLATRFANNAGCLIGSPCAIQAISKIVKANSLPS